MRLILIASAACTLLAGCNTAGCTDNRNALPLAGFYGTASNAEIAVDSLAVWGIGATGDSLLVAPNEHATQVYLPLRSTSASTAFCFAYHQRALDRDELNDTLTLRYTAQPQFVSEDCGVGYTYRITGVECTRHLIERVDVTDSLITNIDRETIKIFFRTAGEGDSQP